MKDFVKKIGNRLLFTWEDVKETKTYEFELSQNEDFSKEVVRKKTSDHFFMWLNPQMGQFWWKVTRLGKEGTSETSDVSTFTITP